MVLNARFLSKLYIQHLNEQHSKNAKLCPGERHKMGDQIMDQFFESFLSNEPLFEPFQIMRKGSWMHFR